MQVKSTNLWKLQTIFITFKYNHKKEYHKNLLQKSQKTHLLPYIISRIQKLPGASPLDPHKAFAMDPIGASRRTQDSLPKIGAHSLQILDLTLSFQFIVAENL